LKYLEPETARYELTGRNLQTATAMDMNPNQAYRERVMKDSDIELKIRFLSTLPHITEEEQHELACLLLD